MSKQPKEIYCSSCSFSCISYVQSKYFSKRLDSYKGKKLVSYRKQCKKCRTRIQEQYRKLNLDKTRRTKRIFARSEKAKANSRAYYKKMSTIATKIASGSLHDKTIDTYLEHSHVRRYVQRITISRIKALEKAKRSMKNDS